MSEQPIDFSALGVTDVPNPFADATPQFSETPTESDAAPRTTNERVERVREFVKGDSQREKREQRAREKAAKTPRKQKGMFVKPLTEIYSTIGSTVFMLEGQRAIKNGAQVPESPCGTAILESAERCAQALDELAYQNEAVRRALMAVTQTSAIGAVVVAHAPIIMAVVMHHAPNMANTVPASMVNGVPNMPDPKNSGKTE